MKTISLISCMLLAFLLFSSPSIMARELAGHDHKADGATAGRSKNNPNVPGKSCGIPKDNPTYAACIGKQKPKKCSPKDKYNRCNPHQG
ncbi:hypothetical protein I3843_03G018800 [Carya illinoinensis]|uniref:Uncharacterized protein n=1 Tax=Carya illinoinensis TaxID=32201 RepID=A0A8T1QXN1_CARIL|nr:hypothetical protein CIPAW_03G022300 [Carya illinoinensis]KAG6719653.1 hypothetical protein I3842_03G016900 [Carya illinoinensis]KAG7985307.1 hypothetical protein I3843_03G018800 [Carya illinoinensis]